jgi:Fungal Zn(2)-Cys(6) binuclear cluster domain
LQHDQKDPTIRSLHARSPEDNDRIDKIKDKGGACGPCRRSKRRCDDLNHCQGCIRRGILSETGFLASLEPTAYTAGLASISLYDLESPALLRNELLAEPDSSIVFAAQDQATKHVNSWFKNVTRSIDSKLFHAAEFERLVSLGISSNGKRNTCFNLELLDIVAHLEHSAYQLEEEKLLAGFARHASARGPPEPKAGRPRAHCVRHLSWVVTNTFTFLKSFADAELFAAINSMSAARATVSIVYASLYRLLLAKSQDLCLFVQKSMQQDFQYCTRSGRKELIEESLRALTHYYRVVAGLAYLDVTSSPEVAALFTGLQGRARNLLENGGVRRLILEIHAKARPGRAQSSHESSPSVFSDILSSWSPEVQEIKPLSISLRVNSGNHCIAPVSTEAIRDADPYRHYKAIKVRDLLKETQDSAIDPKQLFVNEIIGNFDFLSREFLELPGPSDSYPSFFMGQDVLSDSDDILKHALSTSLDPEHASLGSSQQDTDLESVKSETTVQNDLTLAHTQATDPSSTTKSADQGWSNVPRGKGCKRRERSGDSQNSSRSSGRANRKHVKIESGRQSPVSNYFGVLTAEPTVLR